MNKTIFNLDYKLSVIIVSVLGIIFAFLSNAFYVGGLMGFILYVFRFLLFIGVFLILNVIEKNNMEFKDSLKRMIGYLVISSSLNIIFSIFTTTHLLRGFFLICSGIVCFWLIVAFLLEIIKLYFNSKIVDSVLNVNKKIGLAVANPIARLFDTTNG